MEIKQYEFEGTSEKSKIKSIIESLLFVSGEPLSAKDISNTIDISVKSLINIINEMIEEYKNEDRGINIICINGDYQLATKACNGQYIQKLLKKNKRQSLSQASLESLAIIAYKQPITRIDIDEIRGVKSESALLRLLEKGLIKEVGRLEVPGRPILYGTTEEFLRQFSLKELNELPSLDIYSENESGSDIIEFMNDMLKEE